MSLMARRLHGLQGVQRAGREQGALGQRVPGGSTHIFIVKAVVGSCHYCHYCVLEYYYSAGLTVGSLQT